MKNKYDIELQGIIKVNTICGGIINILFKIIGIVVILSSFIGGVGREVDKVYSSIGCGINKLMVVVIPMSLLLYIFILAFKVMGNKSIKISIVEVICCTFCVIASLNYLIYFKETNDKKVVYLLIGYLVIGVINILVDKFIQYCFWKEICIEGVRGYGDNFNEYHEVKVEFNKELSEIEKLDICINELNFGNRGVIFDLIKNRWAIRNIKKK